MKYRINKFLVLLLFMASTSMMANEPGKFRYIQNFLNNKSGMNATASLVSGLGSLCCFKIAHNAYIKYKENEFLLNSDTEQGTKDSVRRILTQINMEPADVDDDVSTYVPDLRAGMIKNRNKVIAWSLVGATSFTISALTGYLTFKSLFNK
ncbi:hypothetical protein HYX58_03160 [Candidatus Dependentiae bacterium]|nr:hypothetical protein [Candidatus Dependentiae bacterium]